MGQVDFAYEMAADAAGLPLAVSVFCDIPHLREDMRDDVQSAGLGLRECGSLASLLEGEARALGEVILIDCPQLDGAALAALRWISQMSEAGLLERLEDETDRRRAFIQLSDKASDGMARYFAELGKSAAALV